ncbi:FecR family protein [Pedobacter paludis]|uniref:Anti-sigma factor n=1 Tax=Pedobacter paludis TaxID=2203212 RepID=A0A317F081_9SPHI|nr:FecR family protein [Pedobacter paludis]PWS32650.1 anti-sigma factor [Pedobacter paludis]
MKDSLKIIKDYRQGKASQKEEELLDLWIHDMEDNSPVALTEAEHEEMKRKGRAQIRSFLEEKNGVKYWVRFAVAATIALAIMIGKYFYHPVEKQSDQAFIASDVEPGRTAATLTLSDGKKLYLADLASGKIAEESGVKIVKNEKGELIYSIIDTKDQTVRMQTLTTYTGETQIVALPDGSKVWLNAASSIKYPSSFAAAPRRRVELAGEAYFEIAKDRDHPFVVETGNQEVEVLGTHFNINAYTDEPGIATTLLEGSVRVSKAGSSQTIVPGQQALNTQTDFKVSKVNTENIVDWKDGEFNLDEVDFRVAMRKIARWYGVELVYDKSVPEHIEAYGWISRSSKLSAVLKLIENSGLVKFRIEGKKLYISN